MKDILCYLHLFHPEYAAGDTHPIHSIISPTKVFRRLANADVFNGYNTMAPLVVPLLKLRDYIRSTFDAIYGKSSKNGTKLRLGSKLTRFEPARDQLFSAYKVNFDIPVGLLYPIAAALRVNVNYSKATPTFIQDPQVFWDRNGHKLVGPAFEMMGERSGADGKKEPDISNFGKTLSCWIALYGKAEKLAKS